MTSARASQILNRAPVDHLVFEGVDHFCFDEQSDSDNPFNNKAYDFDTGFYNGTFSFDSPVTGAQTVDTPEAYGRHRIVSAIVATSIGNTFDVLDIGCGTLDIARMIPTSLRDRFSFVNSDISGPWTNLGRESSLTRGATMLLGQMGRIGYDSVANVQYDFNRSPWPFTDEAFSAIVSNMALHHIQPQGKRTSMQRIHDSLKPGGVLIVNDVYSYRKDHPMLTGNGKRGPAECTGEPEDFGLFVGRLLDAGFLVDERARRAAEREALYTDDDLAAAAADPLATMPVSQSVWSLVARKEN